MADHDSLLSQFAEITSGSTAEAIEYLKASQWDLDSAITSYFADMEDGGNEEAPAASSASPAAAAAPTPAVPEYTGPRTLDGRPAPHSVSASSSSAAAKKPQRRTGIATLGSLGGGGGGHSHDDHSDDDDDSDEDERRAPRDLFAGGEKSGLAVHDPAQRSSDPNRLIRDIVAKAKANARSSQNASPPAESSSAASRFFRGAGNLLGGDGVESRTIPDPQAPSSAASAIPTTGAEAPAEERFLHIWQDGFSIDDGELRRFDDPENQAALQMIRQGRAPLHLMNVRFDQRVDVKLQQHQENYRPLPKVYRPFGGEGHRLGSPVPGEAAAVAAPAPVATAAPVASQGSAAASGVDASQPTLMLRIQMPDGTRLPARFNTTQTVGDVYEFVQRASSDVSGRPWVLSTTFPSKDHTEKDLVLGELAEFKRGGTAVVKWL
ncbi:hypothetical protein B0T17DRAFT_484093 [Bombardia bombarda]|uniref:UBX domain-containing protein 1 n=1 Tax=Bombardia bombarda TaxID=252184 RepID=A0AA40CEY3_9PEZI|nr:hypothetical protein B0T17DRAFT_484093 [Bombardia bombarda]